MSHKPIVYFRGPVYFSKEGVAYCCPINHPSPLVSNTKTIRTSPVLARNMDTGGFETQNTIYLPHTLMKEDEKNEHPVAQGIN